MKTVIAETDDGRYRAGVVSALLAAHARDAARATEALRPSAPVAKEATRSAWLARLRRSRWALPVVKVAGLVLTLVVLAAIGFWADPRPRALIPASTVPLASAVAIASPTASEAPASVPAEAAQAPPTTSAPTDPAPASGVLADGRIVLNVANEEELTKLPHVGVKRAKEIVALRQRLGGRFRAVTDLLRVRGLGRKTLGKIAPKVVLDAPKEAPPPPAPPA